MVDIAKFCLPLMSPAEMLPVVSVRAECWKYWKITDGRGQPRIFGIEHLATAIKEGSLCARPDRSQSGFIHA